MDILNPTFENIEKLAKLVKENDLGEISVKIGEAEISVKGKKCPAPMPMPMTVPAVGQPAASAQSAGDTAPAAKTVSGNEVKAPIVGTFYSAPSPDAAPFVSVGDKVKKGDVIFIIESMKVMSEVQSEFDGVVKEICVKSGEPVEYDQTLMIIG